MKRRRICDDINVSDSLVESHALKTNNKSNDDLDHFKHNLIKNCPDLFAALKIFRKDTFDDDLNNLYHCAADVLSKTNELDSIVDNSNLILLHNNSNNDKKQEEEKQLNNNRNCQEVQGVLFLKHIHTILDKFTSLIQYIIMFFL